MIAGFYALAGIMVLGTSALTLILMKVWRRHGTGESTIDWLKLRQLELAQELRERAGQSDDGFNAAADDNDLLVDAELRVLDEAPLDELVAMATPEIVTVKTPAKSSGDGQASEVETHLFKTNISTTFKANALLLAPILLVIAVLPFVIYLQTGAIEDIRIADQLQRLNDSGPETMLGLFQDIEARSEVRPKNVDYLSLLGQYYIVSEKYDKALDTYEQLLALFPESPEMLARAAQAEYLANDRTLTPLAKRRAESALAIDVNQRTAFSILGMAAFESGNYTQAIEYLERLVALETPGSPGYELTTNVISEARYRAGVPMPKIASDGVKVSIKLPDGDGIEIPSEAIVFILARPAGSAQRMPTAVVRRLASDLPLTVRLDDRSTMAGQKISVLDAVDIEVQVSPNGQPGRANARWIATAVNVVPSATATVALSLSLAVP